MVLGFALRDFIYLLIKTPLCYPRSALSFNICCFSAAAVPSNQAFDSNGYYRGYIPASLGATVVHVIFIQGWNTVYRSVATRLTDRENHRTEEVQYKRSK